MNGYDLSRAFVDWAFENPSKVRPIHWAVYFFAIEHCNRLGWKQEFGLPSYMTMEAIGVKKHATFASALKDLEDWGFISLIERSKNQYTANIITLNAMPKNGKAQGKALDKARSKHREKHGQSTGSGMVAIDKQENPKTLNPKTPLYSPNGEVGEGPSFEEWQQYWRLKGRDENHIDCENAWNYYEEREWTDKLGKKVVNWKNKMTNLSWFKECPKASFDVDSDHCKENPPKDWLDEMINKWGFSRKQAKEDWKRMRTHRSDYYNPPNINFGGL